MFWQTLFWQTFFWQTLFWQTLFWQNLFLMNAGKLRASCYMPAHCECRYQNMMVIALPLLAFSFFSCSDAVLEPHIPHVDSNIFNTQHKHPIECYFHLGFGQHEIICFLAAYYGITLGLRQLKRILRRRGLSWRGNHSSLDDVITAIEKEIEGSGSCIGYRGMWQRLQNNHNLKVSRETVQHALRIIDPEGVSQRLTQTAAKTV